MFAGSASSRGLLGGADPLAQLAEQPRARRQRRVALLVGERDRHLGQRRQRLDQVELVRGEVVEAVEEDRPLAPEGAVAAQQLDRLAGDPVGVDPAAALARLGVAGEEGGEVAEVGGALEGRRRSPRPRCGPTPAACSSSSRRSKARAKPGRAAERRSGPSRPRRRARPRPRSPAAAAAGESSAPGGAPPRGRDGAEERPEGHRRAAQRRALRAELALEGEDVVDGGHDQDRVALERSRRSGAGSRPARPEFGGPWISFSGISASDPA